MAWGLEARVPFLDKAFLEVAMNIDAKEKMFSKGSSQEVDEDGSPKMEKVCFCDPALHSTFSDKFYSTSCERHLTARLKARHTCPSPSFGARRNNSLTGLVTHGLMGESMHL